MLALLVALAVVVLLAWATALVLELPLILPLALTVVIVLGVGLYFAVRAIVARVRADRLQRAMVAQASAGAASLRPDVAADVEELTRELTRAIQTLKASKLKGGGKGALHALPWYVIVGPPGAGKSTALRASGLPFPHLASQARAAVRGVGGTRNCDFWLSNEAILLDTAGRWTTDEDQVEWTAFLDLLRKHRGARALNGIVVAVSVEEVSAGPERARSLLATRVRERIDEVMTRLGTTVPVYVLLTKCDLLPGFVEAFAELRREDRSAPWGFTLPLATPPEQYVEATLSRWGELSTALSQHVMEGVGRERRAEARALALGLPAQVAALREPVAAFVEEVFAPNIYRDTPALRGVYLTSGTQEGRPIDRIVDGVRDAFGAAGVTLPAPEREPRSYFLAGVFRDVMFHDARAAAPTRASARRAQALQLGGALVLGAAACAMGISAIAAYRGNVGLVDETVQRATPLAVRPDGAPVGPGVLAPLRDRVEELLAHEEEGAPLRLRAGLYVGGELRDPAARAYARAVRDGVIAPLLAAEAGALRTWAARLAPDLDARPSAEEHAAYHAALVRQLRLTTPVEAEQPALDDASRAALLAELAALWVAADREAAASPREALMRSLALYLRLAERDASLLLPRDEEAVRVGRLALARLPASRVALDRIVAELEGRGYELTLARLIGASGGALSARGTVRGAFTRRAWEEHVRARIDEGVARASTEAWVLGPSARDAASREEALRRELRSEYFEAYVEEWQSFVRGVRVEAPRDDVRALALLGDLTRGDPTPVARLLLAIDWNVRIADPQPEEANGGAATGLLEVIRERVTQTPRGARAAAVLEAATAQADGAMEPTRLTRIESVPLAFEALTGLAVPPSTTGDAAAAAGGPVPLDAWEEQLDALRAALSTYRDDPSTADALSARLQEARTRVSGLIEAQPAGFRPVLEAILWPPVEGAATTSGRAIATALGRSFCAEVASLHASTLAGRYPFAPDGADASLADVAAFYRPDSGAVWAFYAESLADTVPRDGRSFSLATRFGREGGALYQRSLPAFLTRSAEVTSALFPPGAAEPKVDFDVRIHPTPGAAHVRLSVGGASIDYANGPETWSRVTWPGARPDEGARLEVMGARGMQERLRHDGEWGLFRLLERGHVAMGPEGSRTFTVSFRLESHGVDVVIDVRSVRAESPFAHVDRPRRLLEALRGAGVTPPREIAVGASACGS